MEAMTARSGTWLDGLGEWAWPGTARPAVEVAPASWVPALPLPVALPRALPVRRRRLPRWLRFARLLALLALAAGAFEAGTLLWRHPAVAIGAAPARLDTRAGLDPFASPRLPA